MATAKRPQAVKLRRIEIRNFKSLEEFDIDFPEPKMRTDPDVFLMGSKNGLGKTSVLECCTLLFIAAVFGEESLHIRHPEMPLDVYDLFIRAGSKHASVKGELVVGGENLTIELTLARSRTERAKIKGNVEALKRLREGLRPQSPDAAELAILSLAGLSSDPILLPPLMYFHSYRKVQEGNPELGMMVMEGRRAGRRFRFRPGYEFPVSLFKLEILRSMMSQAMLFETLDERDSTGVLDKLNVLVERYAGGTIQKLRPSPDNTVDFRIHPTNGGKSFTFDGLSSGQKEIISTLFLIWYYSRQSPVIALIDEPELHLNIEWHRDFLVQLHSLAPENQYIIATHSEDLFSSVSEDRRVLLVSSQEAHV